MWTQVLEVVVVVVAGLATGVLVVGAVALVPCFQALPASQYVRVHQLIDRRIDPLVPIMVTASSALALALSLTIHSAARSLLFAIGATLMIGVAMVSLTTAVPLLRRHVRRVDASRLPDDWYDLRKPWRAWHLIRTILAVGSLLAIAAASVGR